MFVLFVFICGEMHVERGMGELREGTVSGRGWVRRGEGGGEEESEREGEGGDKK